MMLTIKAIQGIDVFISKLMWMSLSIVALNTGLDIVIAFKAVFIVCHIMSILFE